MKVRLDEDFEIEIDDKTLDNYELVEALAAVDKGKTGKLTDAVDILFGDAKPALFEHIKEKATVGMTMLVERLMGSDALNQL